MAFEAGTMAVNIISRLESEEDIDLHLSEASKRRCHVCYSRLNHYQKSDSHIDQPTAVHAV